MVGGAKCQIPLLESYKGGVSLVADTECWQEKSVGHKSWHCDRFPSPPPLLYSSSSLPHPVPIYSHHLLCFYHLQKSRASGGGTCSCCLEGKLAPSNSVSRPATQSTKSIHFRSHPPSLTQSSKYLLGANSYLGVMSGLGREK